MKWLDIEDFISTTGVIFDVRAPIEFLKGHIPGACNVPLFSDDERAKIGTIYKLKGKQEAIDAGLEIVGPKMAELVRTTRALTKGKQEVYLHCFRGGMRSQSVAWLLELCGYHVFLLRGGYKSFRSWVMVQFSKSYPLVVLGGLTGSAKTEILLELKQKKEVVIDLEGHADHKGSAFGALGNTEQPTQVQFENQLGVDLFRCRAARRVWVEDESRMIGKRVVPNEFWSQIRDARVLFLDRTIEDRVEHLMEGYGNFSLEALSDCVQKIRKRFGPDRTQTLLLLVEEKKLPEAIALVLTYYDKRYLHGLSKREENLVQHIPVLGLEHRKVAQELIEYVEELDGAL